MQSLHDLEMLLTQIFERTDAIQLTAGWIGSEPKSPFLVINGEEHTVGSHARPVGHCRTRERDLPSPFARPGGLHRIERLDAVRQSLQSGGTQQRCENILRLDDGVTASGASLLQVEHEWHV